MAGAGAKKFPAFSKLSSDDVNNYLADQVIMRFATTTARDAAFGGVGEPTLAEGMTCYIDADNSIYTYDGSNWVKMVSASQPVGTVFIGGASFTNQPNIEVTGFSTEYEWYEINFSGFRTASGSTPVLGVLYNGATARNSLYYGGNGYTQFDGTSGNQYTMNNAGDFYATTIENRYRGNFTMRVFFKAGEQFTYNYQAFESVNFRVVNGAGFRNATDVWDRIRFSFASGNASGSWAMYGRRL